MSTTRVYTINFSNLTCSSIQTLLQITAVVPLELISAKLFSYSSTTLTQIPVEIIRKVAAATSGSSVTPGIVGPSDDPVAEATCGKAFATEGTDGDVLKLGAFNVVNEWEHIFPSDARPYVDAAGVIALKLPTAPSSIALSGEMIFKEKP